ncbi:MAG: hypothetical protein V4536_04820 [Pseudomonadota bacterium]|jgi:hypothetical protein
MNSIVIKAIDWAKSQSEIILQTGAPLGFGMQSMAREMGVKHPERIRIDFVESIPLPDDEELLSIAHSFGLLSDEITSLTLGYGVYIRSGMENIRLLTHEFRHVQQYEQYDSIDSFLEQYIHQVMTVGYRNAPLEIDARAHEIPVYKSDS